MICRLSCFGNIVYFYFYQYSLNYWYSYFIFIVSVLYKLYKCTHRILTEFSKQYWKVNIIFCMYHGKIAGLKDKVYKDYIVNGKAGLLLQFSKSKSVFFLSLPWFFRFNFVVTFLCLIWNGAIKWKYSCVLFVLLRK